MAKLQDYRGWLAEAKTKNPDVPEQQLADYWEQLYIGQRGAPEQADPGFMSDTGNLLKSGWQGIATAGREFGRRLLGETVTGALDKVDVATGYLPEGPESVDEKIQAKQQALETRFTPAMQAARQKDWWQDGPGEALTDWRSYYSGLVESLPSTIATMGPAAKMAGTAGKAIFESTFEKAVAGGMAEAAAKELAEKAAGKALERTAYVAGGSFEGLLQAGQTGFEVRQAVLKMPEGVLQQSDAYQALLAGGMEPAEARKQLSEDSSATSMWLAGTVTGIFGGAGDRILAKAVRGQLGEQTWQRIAKGVVAEGLLEEAPQSFGSKVAENVGLINAGADISLTHGALNEAIGGALVGGIMGGGMTAVLGKNAEPRVADPTAEAMAGIKNAPDLNALEATMVTWSQEQSLAIADSLTRATGLAIQQQDVFPNAAAAEQAILQGRARGEDVQTVPFEATPPEGVQGETQTGVFLARNAPLQETEGRSSFNFPTEEAAQKLDPTGERLRVELAPGGGYTVMPVPGAAAKNIDDLNGTIQKEADRLQARSVKLAQKGDVPTAAKLAGRASAMRQAQYSAVPDAAVKGSTFVRAVANMFGADVQFFQSSQQNDANGWVIQSNGRRVLYINAKATKPHMQVMGHELSHFLEVSEPELYERAKAVIAPLLRTSVTGEVGRRYASTGISDDGLLKEAIGDLFGAELGNRQLWQALRKEDPTLFGDLGKRVLKFLDQVLEAIRTGSLKGFNRNAVTDIKAARQAIVETLAQTARNVEARRQQTKTNATTDLAARDTQSEAGQAAPPGPPSELKIDPAAGPTVRTPEGEKPLMSLDGVEVRLRASVSDTGRTAYMTVDAGKEMLSLDKREQALNDLLKCMRK